MHCVPPKIDAILLDMDGTLVDAFAPIIRAMQQTLKAFQLPALSETDIRRHTGKGDCSMKALFGDHQELATQHFYSVHDEDYLTGIRPLSGAEALLNDLQARKIPVAIVTSKGQHWAEDQLQYLGWLDKIDVIIGKLEGRASKPNPETIFLACDRLGVDASHTIMVGDGVADMKAANRADSYGIGLTASFSDKELREAGALLTFPTLVEVQRWLHTAIH